MFCGHAALFEMVIVVDVTSAVHVVGGGGELGELGDDELLPPQAITAATTAAAAAPRKCDLRNQDSNRYFAR